MEDEQLEEGVHEEDPVRLDGGGVEEHGLRGPVERVGVQDGLDHDEAVRQVLTQKTGPAEEEKNMHTLHCTTRLLVHILPRNAT